MVVVTVMEVAIIEMVFPSSQSATLSRALTKFLPDIFQHSNISVLLRRAFG